MNAFAGRMEGRQGVTGSYLEIRDLVKSYDGYQQAVRGISLAIAKGEFVSFLGPSGSGKTTTLMMVAGFEQPTAGRIVLGGREIAPVPPHKRNIGMVFQNYALFPHMTAAENVGFPLRMRKRPAAEITRRSREALAMVGLADFAGRQPRELSGGQQQRVALARALVFEPDVLLLDEPLGALDKNLREHMQVEIKRIHRELGITTIYVTHDQTEAMTMSDRIAVFSQGVVEQFAAPLDVYLRPATRFVGGFVGDSNFFEASGRTGMLEVAGLGTLSLPQAPVSASGRYDVLVRPEAIGLWRGSGDRAGHCVVPFTVTALVNYGDSVLLIGSSGDLSLRARIPFMLATDIREGTALSLSWRHADMHCIPA
ncbi:MAG: ABC transporter ATP-binding protein [Ferrovibrio sp.]|uniref:ABC transporter ATP-binding protein n=1 Tax=Ferrovibrio sp. TaxID=1917215 RepID=UPI0026296D1E|nr:ABC transporter ATP-binding protein [Ferrovibrio sp.]MCW0234217.1 ABC transporter ATP-binding protein [Ferrovibrio sp.]